MLNSERAFRGRVTCKKKEGDLLGNHWFHTSSIRKAQQSIGMSFGIIFSILLIIFFLIIAFIAIKAFLGTKDCTQVGMFLDDLETEVTSTWSSQGGSITFKRSLPTKIDYVCFANLTQTSKGQNKDVFRQISYYKGTGATLFFYPKNAACKLPYKKIEHLDMEAITKEHNPYCIPVERGVVKIKIERDFTDRLVRVS